MNDKPHSLELEELITEILTNAANEQEQFRAFREALEDRLDLPRDGFVIGEPVSIEAINYSGNVKGGLVATCRKQDGTEHVVTLSDVRLSEGDRAICYLDAYRKWLGVSMVGPTSPANKTTAHKVSSDDLDLSQLIESWLSWP